MTPSMIVFAAASLSLAILGLAFLLCVFRAIVGPTLPDRVLALDMLVAIAIGFIAAVAIKTGFTLYLDIAIALGLVGFLATVAFARFVLTRGAPGDGRESPAAESGKTKRKPKGRKGEARPSSAKLAGEPRHRPESPGRRKGGK